MGCLFVVIMGAVSAALIYFFGYADWVLVVLGLLWLTSLVASLILGHTGFGGGGNTDLQIVIAGLGIAAAIVLPNYNAHKPCSQAKTALQKLVQAEDDYFAAHKTYAASPDTLNLAPNPDVQIKVTQADSKSYTASASHNLCKNEKDGTPKILMWDSAKGGLQN